MLSISLKMFFVVTLPVLIGMILRKLWGNLIENNMKIINKMSIGLFCIVFIAIYIEEWDGIVMFVTKAGTITLTLNITMMVVAFYIAKFFATGVAQRRCISLEAGLQNGTLAVFVGLQLFGTNMTYMVPTAAYALIMMMTSVIFVFILRRQT
jgi:BASS family bile acid:Na+ symporter